MQYIKEDIWDCWNKNNSVICVTTNSVIKNDGCLVMGAGIAKEAATRFPQLPSELGFQVSIYGNVPFTFPEYRVISFPTKDDWRDKSKYSLINNSCLYLKKIIEFHKNYILMPDETINNVYMPKVGCGNGGLEWGKVKEILEKHFINDDNIYVCI